MMVFYTGVKNWAARATGRSYSYDKANAMYLALQKISTKREEPKNTEVENMLRRFKACLNVVTLAEVFRKSLRETVSCK